MAKKILRSELQLTGIAPNLLLKDVENTAPFLFKGEISLQGKNREYLLKLTFYKKNLNQLKYLNLSDYFYLCLASHWASAGTYVPTNVDNQIRHGLWHHPQILSHLEKMFQYTRESWSWNYEQVTNRKSYNTESGEVLSTHEGTWLSVAIGAYNALVKYKKKEWSEEVYDLILKEIKKEENLLHELREKRDHINFLRTCALMAHNLGDLDRVIDQWEMKEDDPERLRIYKLGHNPHPSFSPILCYAGMVNKHFLSVENHRHMSLRQARCLRRSYRFLVPVGPFMEEWGRVLGEAKDLELSEKGEIVSSLFEGYKRQNHAYGYARAFGGMMRALPNKLETLAAHLPFDLVAEIKKSRFREISEIPEEEFLKDYAQKLEEFQCPVTGLKF